MTFNEGMQIDTSNISTGGGRGPGAGRFVRRSRLSSASRTTSQDAHRNGGIAIAKMSTMNQSMCMSLFLAEEHASTK